MEMICSIDFPLSLEQIYQAIARVVSIAAAAAPPLPSAAFTHAPCSGCDRGEIAIKFAGTETALNRRV